MIKDLEISDLKKARKTLLITSFVGYAFTKINKHSSGNIEFLGFKIPNNDSEIPNLIGFMIIFLLIALIIRYKDDGLKKKIEEYHKRVEEYDKIKNTISFKNSDNPIPKINDSEIFTIKTSVTLLDLIFPIILALYVLYKIYFPEIIDPII